MEMVSKALRNWKIHALALVILVIAEFIGNIAFSIGPAKVVLIPMLYAFVLGALCGVFKLVNMEDMEQTSSLVGVTFFLLMARYGTLVGPSFWKVVHSAPALLLQEFGNLGTMLIGMPFALLLGMRREAVGATVSICREPTLGLISEIYGINSPEGLGVMGTYMVGNLFGAIFFSVLGSFSVLSGLDPRALAMACGMGSGSMMTAASQSLMATVPELKDEISAFAATSNIMTNVTGLYMDFLIALPCANFLYKLFVGRREKKNG